MDKCPTIYLLPKLMGNSYLGMKHNLPCGVLAGSVAVVPVKFTCVTWNHHYYYHHFVEAPSQAALEYRAGGVCSMLTVRQEGRTSASGGNGERN
jgi:hypothetical protein